MLSLLPVIAAQTCYDFPDGAPSYCQINAVFKDVSCQALFESLEESLTSWRTGGPNGGFHTILHTNINECIRSTRLSWPVQKVLFENCIEFNQLEGACYIQVKSSSQSFSEDIQNQTFCTVWTFLTTPALPYTVHTEACPHSVLHPEQQCRTRDPLWPPSS